MPKRLLNKDDYNAIRHMQGGHCAICGAHWTFLPKSLAVDHDHVTGEIRGLLCFSCNVGVGHFADDPYLLRRAAEYLEAHAAQPDIWERMSAGSEKPL